MKIQPVKTSYFKPKENLPLFIKRYIPALKEGSILAVSSKVAGLWEGRIADVCSREKLIKENSQLCIKTALCYFTIVDGMVMTNAGIDQSNIKDKLALLPKEPYKTAAKLRKELCAVYKIKNLGVILTDSMILPLRTGVISAAVGYAGFKGVKDYRGKRDIFGRKFQTTLVDIADTLAASAGFMMGEGRQKTPLAVIEDAPVVFTARQKKGELKYPLKDDLYYPFFKPFASSLKQSGK